MVHKRVVPGDKKQQILREAEAIHPDLIVLGSHSDSGSGRDAYSVVVSATCPVLSFHAPIEQEQPVKEKDSDPVFASMQVNN